MVSVSVTRLTRGSVFCVVNACYANRGGRSKVIYASAGGPRVNRAGGGAGGLVGMIYLKCQCGSGLGVPGSFLGERIRCDECGRALRLVAAHEVTHSRAVRWQFRVEACPSGSGGNGELVLLGGETPVVAGSGDGCQLRLPGTLVSRAHCRLVPFSDGWMLEDADSRNGTFVNGSRVTNHELRSGDLVDVGEWTLEYQPVGPAVKSA